MAFCGEASTWAKLSLLLLVLAFSLHCTGYGTNYWMARNTARDKSNFGIGLWKMTDCSGSYKAPCTDGDIPDSYMKKYVKAVRGMESIALILIFVPTICLAFYVGSQRSRTRGMAIAIISLVLGAVVFSIIGMIVWLAYMPEFHYAGWSMGLTVFAITLCITAAIILIPDIREYDYKDMLKVGGEFQNLPVTKEDYPPPSNDDMYRADMKPVVEAHGRMAAPVYQFLNYDKKRKMDGF
ncbi:uncharacterized protein LOC132734229 [Ruditapes philippinarum]|uniref:uncharacterized protein LOC132734229 n=1 Tax=Ruditapes philippinarum TaxID=129788 RepID=UPI00295BB939|nr:uncharacterized protein LOC132734229 [Ruditapes philippinarum]